MNKRSPLVSIIIPYYNHKQFVSNTLDSILADSYVNKEIVIINDGSSDTDDSAIRDWIAKHEHEITVHYTHRENKGLLKTLNELITKANGEYLLPLASDDYLVNNTIQERVTLLESRPDKLMLLSDVLVVDDDNKKLYDSYTFECRHKDKSAYTTDATLQKQIIREWAIAGPSIFVHKSLYDIVGKYDETLMVEDWDFALRVVAKDLMLFHDQVVSAYRLHNNNTCTDEALQYTLTEQFAKVADQNLKYFNLLGKFYLWRKRRTYRRALKKFNR